MTAAVQTAPRAQARIAHVVPLARMAPPLLAMGAWFKNTLCAARGRQACVSPGVGDLDSPEACRAHEAIAHDLLGWLQEPPHAIVHDLHPDFHSSRFAAKLAAELRVPLLAVQHHHAHIAAVCAEHGIERPLIGLALDGVGLGTDDTAWGGELLHVDGACFGRVGYLHPLPLPGGDRAAREPWRMAAAALHELGRNGDIAGRFPQQAGAAMVAAMLQRGLNCPRTSSMGRLFDAAAGLLGVCATMEFEAQAAIRLEQLAANHGPAAPLAHGFEIGEDGVLDFRPLLMRLADCDDAAYGAALFHATLAEGLARWVGHAAERSGLAEVALAGGCFLNGVLAQALQPALAARGLTVLKPRQLPPGDSAISLGQAWVALQQLTQGN